MRRGPSLLAGAPFDPRLKTPTQATRRARDGAQRQPSWRRRPPRTSSKLCGYDRHATPALRAPTLRRLTYRTGHTPWRNPPGSPNPPFPANTRCAPCPQCVRAVGYNFDPCDSMARLTTECHQFTELTGHLEADRAGIRAVTFPRTACTYVRQGGPQVPGRGSTSSTSTSGF